MGLENSSSSSMLGMCSIVTRKSTNGLKIENPGPRDSNVPVFRVIRWPGARVIDLPNHHVSPKVDRLFVNFVGSAIKLLD